MIQGASQLGNEKTINIHVQVTPINKQWSQLLKKDLCNLALMLHSVILLKPAAYLHFIETLYKKTCANS